MWLFLWASSGLILLSQLLLPLLARNCFSCSFKILGPHIFLRIYSLIQNPLMSPKKLPFISTDVDSTHEGIAECPFTILKFSGFGSMIQQTWTEGSSCTMGIWCQMPMWDIDILPVHNYSAFVDTFSESSPFRSRLMADRMSMLHTFNVMPDQKWRVILQLA